MKTSIAIKLIIYFLLLSLASTAIIGLYSYEKAHEALINRTYEQLVSVRTEKNNRLNAFFMQRLNDVTLIANLFSSNASTSAQIIDADFLKYLKGYLQASQSYKNIIIANSDSILLVTDIFNSSFNKLAELDANEREKIKNIWKDKSSSDSTFIIELQSKIKDNSSSIYIAKAYKNTKNIQGMVFLELDPISINSIMFEDNPHNGLGQSGEAYLVGADYLMRSNSRFRKDAPFNILVKTEGVVDAFIDSVGQKRITDYRGIPVFSSYSQVGIEGLHWIILAEIDVREAMIPIYNIRNNIIFLSLLIAILLVGVVAILSNMIAAPIKKLKQETEKVAKGIYGKTIVNSREDEIGDLIVAFNQMTMQLKEQSERLELERLLRSSSMIDGQEMERQRLSRELHDSLGQLILTIKMKLERAINSDHFKAREILIETQTLFSSTVQEIRNISNNLMPAVLSEFGIVTGLKNLAAEITKNTGLEIEFNANNTAEKYNERVDIYLYRITQEAINNALKHSKASYVIINFREVDNAMELEVIDNGIGFNKNAKMGNGISNMRERANLMGGTFTVSKNANGIGTIVTVIVPK